MTFSPRDRRALVLLGSALVLIVILRIGIYSDKPAQVVAALDSVPLAEKRLTRLRQLAATIPGKQSTLKHVSAEAAGREKGIIQAPTAQQAQAHLLETLRRVGKTEAIDVRGGEFPPVQPLGEDYGEAAVIINFDCRIEQLVNFLADLTAEPELLSTRDIRVVSSNQKEKKVGVRLTLAGVVPRKLVPEKKGVASF
jgi:hypothetical protein